MKLSRTLTLAALVTIFVVTAQAAPPYHVIPIGSGYAEGINDKGDVVGETAFIGGYPSITGGGHAFLYTSGNAHKKATYTDLGVYHYPIPSQFNFTSANAINNSGVIVGGTSYNENDPPVARFDAFIYKNGKFSIIAEGSIDGGQTAQATAINNRGDIVGGLDILTFLHEYYSAEQAFLYSNGIVTPLGTLGASTVLAETYSYATSINNAGQIVGVSSNGVPNGYNGFLWMNGKMHAIGSPSFRPNAINDNGWIVGSDSSGAVLYVYGLTIKLGAGEAVSLNNSGVVVGNFGERGNPTGGFIYFGRMYDLNTLIDGGW
ncbi:MAG TPA: DUF3466 family protein, partial [Bacteroidia bacterium]|nr:DUF3466 family protein [Bacteroidia bacterium]